MGNLGELSPYEARDAADFVASMQRLKEHAGLTYRDLEERAARNGDVLARSTLADILRRTSLPRPDVLAAFVRACGDGERVDAWLDARERIAERDASAPAPGRDADGEPAPRTEEAAGARPRRADGRTALLAAGLAVPLLALAAWGLLPETSDGAGDADGSGTRASADASGAPAVPGRASRAPVDGWVTVRPARTPDLCLTDGRDRRGAYGSAVAVQLPCARATVPRTYLEPFGEGFYRIQWHHPQLGKGCLTVMDAGPAKGMLEPRDDCDQGTLFRLEAAAGAAGGFRLRPAHRTTCIGMAGDDRAEGAEAVEERCTGGADQRFLVRAD
ncbi:RICIN domain-containing protein [Streptomyces sp. NPDC051677]|uniref:RICIN domain-containing protein n=1 Tax=Streptomyces sp. NPDC051677 TaxID=3365669 RepID=UPI0037D982C2